MNSKEKKIGLVGVGRMGANMARNLKDKGYQISCVNDVDKDIAGSLAGELGCNHASTLAKVTVMSRVKIANPNITLKPLEKTKFRVFSI